MSATIKQNKTFDLRSQARAERTPGAVAVSGYMAKGAGKSLVRVFASTQVTNSGVAVAVAGGAAEPLNLTTRKKSAFGYALALAWRWWRGV